MKSAKMILLVFGFTAFTLVSAVHAQTLETPSCNNATIAGYYAFTITGQILPAPLPTPGTPPPPPPPPPGPVTGVAMTYFDGRTATNGQGSVEQIDHVVHNGGLPAVQWRYGAGHYQINPNCTGWMTVLSDGTSSALTLYFVIGDDGNKIQTVVSDPYINITSSATRVRHPEE